MLKITAHVDVANIDMPVLITQCLPPTPYPLSDNPVEKGQAAKCQDHKFKYPSRPKPEARLRLRGIVFGRAPSQWRLQYF